MFTSRLHNNTLWRAFIFFHSEIESRTIDVTGSTVLPTRAIDVWSREDLYAPPPPFPHPIDLLPQQRPGKKKKKNFSADGARRWRSATAACCTITAIGFCPSTAAAHPLHCNTRALWTDIFFFSFFFFFRVTIIVNRCARESVQNVSQLSDKQEAAVHENEFFLLRLRWVPTCDQHQRNYL